MKAQVLKGSKQQIAESVIQISGEVCEAIVFVNEPVAASVASLHDCEDIFAEMRPFMVDVPEVDDSRESIYSRMASE